MGDSCQPSVARLTGGRTGSTASLKISSSNASRVLSSKTSNLCRNRWMEGGIHSHGARNRAITVSNQLHRRNSKLSSYNHRNRTAGWPSTSDLHHWRQTSKVDMAHAGMELNSSSQQCSSSSNIASIPVRSRQRCQSYATTKSPSCACC